MTSTQFQPPWKKVKLILCLSIIHVGYKDLLNNHPTYRLLFCMIAQILALLTPRMVARVFHSRTVDIILTVLVITPHMTSSLNSWTRFCEGWLEGVDLIWHLNWFVFPHGEHSSFWQQRSTEASRRLQVQLHMCSHAWKTQALLRWML